MCLFKKKKKIVVTGNKYEIGQSVRFKYRGEVCPAVIYEVKLDNDNKIIYDVQLGGECPIIVNDIPEEKIFVIKK